MCNIRTVSSTKFGLLHGIVTIANIHCSNLSNIISQLLRKPCSAILIRTNLLQVGERELQKHIVMPMA